MITNFGAYLSNLVASFDQTGNALAAGNRDSTVSARCFYCGHDTTQAGRGYWAAMEWIINVGFYLIDGKGHCEQAYMADPTEAYSGFDWGLWWHWTLAALLLPGAVIVSLVVAFMSALYVLAVKLKSR